MKTNNQNSCRLKQLHHTGEGSCQNCGIATSNTTSTFDGKQSQEREKKGLNLLTKPFTVSFSSLQGSKINSANMFYIHVIICILKINHFHVPLPVRGSPKWSFPKLVIMWQLLTDYSLVLFLTTFVFGLSKLKLVLVSLVYFLGFRYRKMTFFSRLLFFC